MQTNAVTKRIALFFLLRYACCWLLSIRKLWYTDAPLVLSAPKKKNTRISSSIWSYANFWQKLQLGTYKRKKTHNFTESVPGDWSPCGLALSLYTERQLFFRCHSFRSGDFCYRIFIVEVSDVLHKWTQLFGLFGIVERIMKYLVAGAPSECNSPNVCLYGVINTLHVGEEIPP